MQPFFVFAKHRRSGMNQTVHLVFGQEHKKNISVDIRENDVLFLN